ncbi:hypothetical protein KCP70_06620 [Salmonella enterica subsp. enterica]|nr:hypothetical protein KCP70_06620 [Salmonella enterica subsp. enterica]
MAHECILDIRPLKEETGIQQAGYCQASDRPRFPCANHVFPVAGTLMLEPTESEEVRLSWIALSMRCWLFAQRLTEGESGCLAGGR